MITDTFLELQATDPICLHRQWLWYYRAGMGGLCWAQINLPQF